MRRDNRQLTWHFSRKTANSGGKIHPEKLNYRVTLSAELRLKRKIVLCLESQRRTVSGVEIIPWQAFLDELWGG